MNRAIAAMTAAIVFMFSTPAVTNELPVYSTGEVAAIERMAEVIYLEVGHEGGVSFAAVAHVIANRVRLYGGTYLEEMNPNAFTGLRYRSRLIGANLSRARHTASHYFLNHLPNPIGRATHFYNPRLVCPSWAKHGDLVALIGDHVYLENVDENHKEGKEGTWQVPESCRSASSSWSVPEESGVTEAGSSEEKSQGSRPTRPFRRMNLTCLTV